MNSVSKTLYIPLYGKALVSKRGLFLRDEMAVAIWEREAFPLKRKARSKWLAYYMGIRAAVFDDWVKGRFAECEDAVVLHLGCGMDSRALRVGGASLWYDVDLPEVIAERKGYFPESDTYQMLACDVRDGAFLAEVGAHKRAVVVMEGVGMYLTESELRGLFAAIAAHFDEVSLLADFYTALGAQMSRIKNPVSEVGVRRVWGIDDPRVLEDGALRYERTHDMTPMHYVEQLHGAERRIFRMLYAGAFAKKLYRLYEFKKG